MRYKKILITISLIFCLSVGAQDYIFSSGFEANTIPRAASRTTGVAPLSVFFTAGFSDSTPIKSDFHDFEYSWDFGDTPFDTWGTSGKPKNIDKGPVASHLFENPGVYTVSLSIRNETQVVDADTFTITVLDPDAVFSASKTICISDVINNNFDGCPSGANHITTDNLSEMDNYVGSGRRILLHRGSSWTKNAGISVPGAITTFHIGAYGVCQSPSAQGICINAPHITLGNVKFIKLDGIHDFRLTDTSFTAEHEQQGEVIDGAIGIQQLLVFRVKAMGFASAIDWSHWRNNDNDRIVENSVISCHIGETSNNVSYLGSEKLSYMGNIVFDSEATHTSRIWLSYQGVISHNIISGASYGGSNGRHALKLHGPSESVIGTYAETGGIGLPHRSKFTIIANNIFGGSGPWPVSIGPQDSSSDQRLSDIIIEKNKMLASFGTQSDTPVTIGLIFEGRYITARNNILDGTTLNNDYIGISVTRRGIEATPLGNRVYNNTIYRNTEAVNGAIGIDIDSSASDTVIRNNFIAFPGVSNQTLINDSSGSSIFDHNLLNNNHGFVDPNNNDPLLRNFSLFPTSPAINQGISVPVLDDFDGINRTQDIYDLGAFYY